MGKRDNIELRESSDGSEWTLAGYASKYGVRYPVRDHRGSYIEQFRKGAYNDTVAGDPNVRLLVGHDPGSIPLARTKPSRTLTLTADDVGLHFTARLARDNPRAQEAVSAVRRGDMTAMSVAFRVEGDDGQSWSPDFSQRTIRKASVDGGEISIVPGFGANPEAEVNFVRADTEIAKMTTANELSERRALAQSVGLAVRASVPGKLTVVEHRLADGETECPTCNGSGTVVVTCSNCDGDGVIEDGNDQARAAAKFTVKRSPAEIEARRMLLLAEYDRMRGRS